MASLIAHSYTTIAFIPKITSFRMSKAHCSTCSALSAFVLFRLADIFKPGPIGLLDRRLHSGLGIMADDLLAGALCAAVLGPMAFYWSL